MATQVTERPGEEAPGASDHVHAWPRSATGWEELSTCAICGLMLLKQFIHSSEWVIRRVESIRFLDDRTVRRRVSLDYQAPRPAVALIADEDSTMAVKLLRFDRPAMKVASSEGARRHFIFDADLLDAFDRRIADGLAVGDHGRAH